MDVGTMASCLNPPDGTKIFWIDFGSTQNTMRASLQLSILPYGGSFLEKMMIELLGDDCLGTMITGEALKSQETVVKGDAGSGR